jgi:hypothetical protein
MIEIEYLLDDDRFYGAFVSGLLCRIFALCRYRIGDYLCDLIA